MKLARNAYGLLTQRERRQSWLVLILMIVVALFEVVGTVSFMPFLAVLADPERIENSEFLTKTYNFFEFRDTRNYLVWLGVFSFVLLCLSAVMRAVGQFVIFRFSQLRGYSISRRLMENYLRQPYSFYLSRHSGELNQKVLSESMMLANQVYLPISQFVAQSVLVLALLALLILINPIVAIASLATLGSCFALIYFASQGVLSRAGQSRVQANKTRYRVATETFSGVKTLKLMGGERISLGRYGNATLQLAKLQAKIQILGQLPRFGIEVVAFGGIILLSIVLLSQSDNGSSGEFLPLLGLYAFVGYRLMPAIQKIYYAATQIRVGAAILDAVSNDLSEPRDLLELPKNRPNPLTFKNEVCFENVSFRHEGANEPSLNDITFVLQRGKTLGVIGSTGAGKTTMMDVFLGLLHPETGVIKVDGVPLKPENVRVWQSGIGYVPQDIFLVDGTVAENIAFGLPNDKIDQERVVTCARMAQISDYIEDRLPNAYQTTVGERGVKLSGGQKQRIGIARALYHDPSILVFDEATSALDTVTEKAVVQTIESLAGTKTMMIVAHRLSTIRDCDQILVLDSGWLVAKGTYQELYTSSDKFRMLVDAQTNP